MHLYAHILIKICAIYALLSDGYCTYKISVTFNTFYVQFIILYLAFLKLKRKTSHCNLRPYNNSTLILKQSIRDRTVSG